MESLQAPGIALAIILGLMLAGGNFTAIAAIRLVIVGRIDANSLGGIRTNATRASDAAWLAAHEAAWPWALVLNGLGMIAGIATMFLGTTVVPFLVAGATAAGALDPGLPRAAAHRALEARAAAWSPWRSYAAMHLWRAAAR
jgi:hypothetical protein